MQLSQQSKSQPTNQQAFQTLVADDPIMVANGFVVPNVLLEEWTTDQVLVSACASGRWYHWQGFLFGSRRAESDWSNCTILYLTMKENSLSGAWRKPIPIGATLCTTKQTMLIAFGATREYPKSFVDGYLRIVWANANRDEETLLDSVSPNGVLEGRRKWNHAGMVPA
jgi:aarF domain-containing kinase